MKKSNVYGWMTLSLLITAAIFVNSFDTAQAQEEKISEVLAKARGLYSWGSFDEGITLANGLFKRPNLIPQDSIAIYEVLSILYNAKGDKFKQTALEYLEKISKIGPCLLNLPREYWPSGLRREWYAICYDTANLGPFTCSAKDDTTATKIRTIAVPLPFENNSIGEFQTKLGGIGTGLAQSFLGDFSKISSLKIVERDKIDFLIKEQQLATSGMVDQSTAIKAGKILSAHLMIFGGFTQIDKNNTIMIARVVNVETSEIIAVLDQKGGSNYFEMEKELVKKICDQLDILLSEQEIKQVEMGGTESLDATAQYALGLEYEDKYDYPKAFEHFMKASEIDPDFIEAKKKVDVYRPFVI
jgi:tetratricopeptide (TPR) repeat protein